MSCAPNRWAVMTAKPLVSPKKMPIELKNSGPHAPSAASASTPIVRPTIIVSETL